MPRLFFLIVAMILCALPASASDGCDDLWFTRNLIMDRAGHCFESTLGRSVFDNSDCSGKNVDPPPYLAGKIRQIKEVEARIGCKVNTNRSLLDLDDISIRRRLVDLPVLEEFPGKCSGWIGATQSLYAGHDLGSEIIGEIGPDNDVLFFHVAVNDAWTYVVVSPPESETVISGGWYHFNGEEAPCRQMIP